MLDIDRYNLSPYNIAVSLSQQSTTPPDAYLPAGNKTCINYLFTNDKTMPVTQYSGDTSISYPASSNQHPASNIQRPESAIHPYLCHHLIKTH
jgi:hypothetical protein